MNFEELTPELQEKLKAAKTEEELLAIAAAEGVDLSSEMLKGIAGGLGPMPGPGQGQPAIDPLCPTNQNAICENYFDDE